MRNQKDLLYLELKALTMKAQASFELIYFTKPNLWVLRIGKWTNTLNNSDQVAQLGVSGQEARELIATFGLVNSTPEDAPNKHYFFN